MAIIGLFFWQFFTVYVASMFIFSSINVLDKSLLSLSKTMEGGQRVSQGKNITTLLCYASFFTEASTPTYQGEIMTFVYFLTSWILDNKHGKIVRDNQDFFMLTFENVSACCILSLVLLLISNLTNELRLHQFLAT